MTASELRIGNYVNIQEPAIHWNGDNFKDTIFEIEVIYPKKVYFKGCASYEEYGSLKPIPLTEEWLIRFGFEKIKNYRGFFYGDVFKHEINAYNTWFYVYFFTYNATGESTQYYKSYFETRHHEKIEYLDNYGNFDYVHQLQNLYFALTGEELTIKK